MSTLTISSAALIGEPAPQLLFLECQMLHRHSERVVLAEVVGARPARGGDAGHGLAMGHEHSSCPSSLAFGDSPSLRI